jgi:FkbM family methyltransferase
MTTQVAHDNDSPVAKTLLPMLLEIQSRFARSQCKDTSGAAEKIKFHNDRIRRAFITIVKHLQPDLLLEIGAHEGSFSQRMKKLLPSARSVAFEANPTVFERHRARLQKLNIEYVQACVAAEVGRQTLSIPVREGRARAAGGSIMERAEKEQFETLEVESLRLDDFLGEDSAKKSVMWIDVEGAVAQVFAGGQKALSNCVAIYVELETYSRWAGQMLASDAIPYLLDRGLLPVLRDCQRPWQGNYIFVHSDALQNPKIAAAITSVWEVPVGMTPKAKGAQAAGEKKR